MSTVGGLHRETAFERITQILGCKWSLHIFDCLEQGISRPSAIERGVEGLSARVLHRCLNRLEKDGLLAKTVYQEIPPHVEYGLTEAGRRFGTILREARNLAADWTGDQPPVDLSQED